MSVRFVTVEKTLDFTIIITGIDLGVQLDSLWARERFQEGCELSVLMGFASSGG